MIKIIEIKKLIDLFLASFSPKINFTLSPAIFLRYNKFTKNIDLTCCVRRARGIKLQRKKKKKENDKSSRVVKQTYR